MEAGPLAPEPEPATILSTLNSKFRAQGNIRGQWPDWVWTPPWGTDVGLVSLHSEITGAGLVWIRWTSVKMCQWHLLSPAWIQRGKKNCQMGWNTWHSWLVRTGERKPQALDSKLIADKGIRWKIFYEYENHTVGRELDVPASLRMPSEHLSANTFLSFCKSDSR